MGETAIQWCDYTFNPWRGCTKATFVDADGKTQMHEACLNCYAEQNVGVKMHGIRWGHGQPRIVKAESGWSEPLRWARAAAKAGERRKVFCASLADVLDEEAPPEAQARLWGVIRDTVSICRQCRMPRHPRGLGGKLRGALSCLTDASCRVAGEAGLDWLLLTKRPDRWRVIPEDVRPLVWLGTSIADQQTADIWVLRLLAAEGFRVRFLSVEPQVGPIDLTRLTCQHCGRHDVTWGEPGSQPWCNECDAEMGDPGWLDGIDWVIQGGESGPRARPFDLAWARSLRDQCKSAGVAWFFKQAGARPTDGGVALSLRDSHGGDLNELPPDLRVREFPEVCRGH